MTSSPTVVTSDQSIRALSDLKGHSLAAATGTTNHAMFEWFAMRGGLDLKETELLNQTTAGLSTMALVGRADAVEIWEPAHSSLLAARPSIRSLDIGFGHWEKEFGTADIPYLGLAAHRQWAQDNPDVVRTLFDIYSAAAEWTTRNPQAAAAIIAKATPRGKPATIEKLIRDNKRLRLHVAPAKQITPGIDAVFRAGQETGYLSASPPRTIVHQEL